MDKKKNFKMDKDTVIYISVIFFAEKRNLPPTLNGATYRPHLVVKGDDEYLGVCFIDSTDCIFDNIVYASIQPLYENVNYSKLSINTSFLVMEGSNIVGEGKVEEIMQREL